MEPHSLAVSKEKTFTDVGGNRDLKRLGKIDVFASLVLFSFLPQILSLGKVKVLSI